MPSHMHRHPHTFTPTPAPTPQPTPPPHAHTCSTHTHAHTHTHTHTHTRTRFWLCQNLSLNTGSVSGDTRFCSALMWISGLMRCVASAATLDLELQGWWVGREGGVAG